MKNFITAVIVSGAMGVFPLMAQDKKDMPMKEGMPMKGEGMQGGGMDMTKMKEMHGRMMEMKKGMGGMMGEMLGMMEHMSSGKMTPEDKMTPEEMSEMSKMMGNMSAMMKHMSERMGRGMEPTK